MQVAEHLKVAEASEARRTEAHRAAVAAKQLLHEQQKVKFEAKRNLVER
eukprot:SAG22_NODE_4318_length_1306_cov_2.320630_1_plen_49_part_00